MQKSSYIAGGNVEKVTLQVEDRNERMRGGWTTKSILKDNPMEDGDWLGVSNDGEKGVKMSEIMILCGSKSGTSLGELKCGV